MAEARGFRGQLGRAGQGGGEVASATDRSLSGSRPGATKPGLWTLRLGFLWDLHPDEQIHRKSTASATPEPHGK